MKTLLKRFLDGLAFGAGLAVAFGVLWIVWTMSFSYLLPKFMGDSSAPPEEPEFEHPVPARLVEPAVPNPTNREYSFFRHPTEPMAIPEGGGLLAMAPVATPEGAKRPSTFQLWLTEAAFWQVRTTEDQIEVERLPYPRNASARDVDRVMEEQLGAFAEQSAMTVSEDTLRDLRATGQTWRDDHLNGTLSVTEEGVVLVLPSPYDEP